MKKAMRNIKRGISLLLALVMALGLMACGKKMGTSEESIGTFYVPEKIEYAPELDRLDGACAAENSVYMLGILKNETGGEEQMLRVSLEDGAAQQLPGYQPAGKSAAPARYFSAATLRAGADETLWQMERLDAGTADGGNARWVLRQLDLNGSEIFRFERKEEELKGWLGAERIHELAADRDGDIVVLGDADVAVLSREGEMRFALPVGNGAYEAYLVVLGDGCVGVAYFFSDDSAPCIRLQVIDKDAREWGKTFFLPGWGGRVYDGNENALFYYMAGENLCAAQADIQDAGEDEMVLNWVDMGIDSNLLRMVAPMDGERIAVMTAKQPYAPRSQVASGQTELLCLAASEAPPERAVLTYATLGLNSGDRMAILQFNRTNPDYQIIVKDYMDYSVDGSRDAAMFRLITEVGAGKIPDILAIENMPVARWGSAGLLEDLWPWIDRDPEICREDLMERVVHAMEMHGKLYDLTGSFQFRTMVGARDLIGDRMTWTPDDMLAVLERMPEGSIATHEGGTGFLLDIVGLDWDRFVDWEKGVCHFDGDEFRSILEFCRNFPERVMVNQWDNLHEGRQAVSPIFPADFQSVQMAKAVLNGEISYIGYPTVQGTVGSSFASLRTISMTSACIHKEGAWAFLRTLLLPQPDGFTQAAGFPINKADFDKMAQKAMTSAPAEAEVWGGIVVQYKQVTQEEYHQLMELYEAVDTFYRRDPNLQEIISNIAGACFAGDKTLDETAALIQNRAQLYVNEQK